MKSKGEAHGTEEVDLGLVERGAAAHAADAATGSDDVPRAGRADFAPDSRDGADVAERPSDGKLDEDGLSAELIEDEVQQQVAKVISTRGPIPNSAEFYQYEPGHQERILRMAEAYSTDESGRRDAIVASSITIAKRQQWQAPVLLVVCMLFALGSYAAFESLVLSGFFVSLPVLRVIGAAVTSSIRERRGDDE